MAGRKQKKRLINKFIQVFLTTFALLMIVIGIGTVIYVVVSQQNISKPTESSNYQLAEHLVKQAVDGEDFDNPLDDKKLTTFAVFGVDKDNYRTDVNMIVFFNHETAKIDILSVPRDTQVKIPDEIYAKIQSRRSDVNQIVKINEVPAYVIEDRNETSVAVLENSLGIDIDYYVNMNLDVFRFIVDEIGLITVDIPMDMEYSDPDQDLFINLKAGEQQLNGAQAEQLIRFRSGYGTGDIGRIGMQHEFMMAFADQLLSTRNRLNMVNILTGIMVRVDTDFMNAVDYLIYLDQINPESFEMHMLPGKADNSKRSYYIYDYDLTKALLNEIVNEPYTVAAAEGDSAAGTEGDTTTDSSEGNTSQDPVVDVEPETIIDVKNLTISVQNGTNVGGYAGGVMDQLNDAGYDVLEAINYPGKAEEGIVSVTRLIVPAEEAFEELKTFFDDPEMELKPAMMDEEVQIIVVLGESDAPE